MKATLTLLITLISLFGLSQIDVSFPNLKVVYEGPYGNLIQVNTVCKKKRIANVICEGCSEISKYNTVNQWVLVPADSAKHIVLNVFDRRGRKLGSDTILVKPAPLPNLYFDSIGSNKKLTSLPSNLFLSIDPSIPLNYKAMPIWWEIKIGETIYKGLGRELSREVLEGLLKVGEGFFIINVEFLSPMGKRSLKEIIEFELN